MPDNSLLDASCRVALAAFLHDLGKFAERARIDEAAQKDREGNSSRDLNVQLYCPKYNERHTHIHAAYTAIGLDLLERHMPDLVGDDMTPFKPWKDRDADDSLINAAAMHHKPGTFLQWVIATADRVASGFERDKFDREYNAIADDDKAKLNHYTTRQLTLLEQIRLDGKQPELHDLKYRYALKPLTVESLFPQTAADCQPQDNKAAQAEYQQLWNGFRAGLELIPKSHRSNLPLWLDHFDTLWQVFTHAIPSATVSSLNPNIKADVSLYDHSKTTAALAVALWRYHQATGQESGKLEDWEKDKFLLVQGDFFGIQDFIFASGGETRKRAAKLLRGRSFYVSLLMECAALKIMDALGLPSTSQVINAAGKFLIVAPNTDDAKAKLVQVQQELNQWFLQHTFGQSGIGLASLAASCNDFTQEKFSGLMKKLFEQLETVKLRRFNLCNAKDAVFDPKFLERFEHGECKVDGHSPGEVEKDGMWISSLAADQIDTGTFLTNSERLLMTREPTGMNKALSLPIFNFHISFTGDQDTSGKFGQLAREGKLLRVVDFSQPKTDQELLWNGYARRAINAWIPKATEQDLQEAEWGKYADVEEKLELGDVKTLNHLACDDKTPSKEKEGWVGISALMTLKGDVDNLGVIFQRGLGENKSSFAKMAALSRQTNAFFSIWLPYLCQTQYRNTYTVFAGGDDFFLIGPWHSTMKLAQEMQTAFTRYVGENKDVHFSAGLSITKPGLPINYLADMAEAALEDAKKHNPENKPIPPKNAVTCFGRSASWLDFVDLLDCAKQLNTMRSSFDLSTGYLYGLLHLVNLAADRSKPENAVWHSRFAYRTYRMLETRRRDGRKLDEAERRRLQTELSYAIANQGIEKHKGNYRIALFTHLYKNRR